MLGAHERLLRVVDLCFQGIVMFLEFIPLPLQQISLFYQALPILLQICLVLQEGLVGVVERYFLSLYLLLLLFLCLDRHFHGLDFFHQVFIDLVQGFLFCLDIVLIRPQALASLL